MIKSPIYIIEQTPNKPICLWCQKPLEQVGPQTSNLLPPIIKMKRFVCIYHPHDIVYTFKHSEDEPWFLSSIILNVSPTLRLFYSHNRFVSLQKCLGETSTWGFVAALTDKEDSWPHNLNYDELISKVKGYLPFL